MTQNFPLVAVVVPAFNTEQYIQDALRSLIEQKYENWRAYIVNDGSTDKTGQILDNVASSECRFKVIHQKNSGLGEARNTALDAIDRDGDAEYVVFLDSDDILEKGYLFRLVQLAKQYSSDFVVCGAIWFDNSGDWQFNDQPYYKTGNITYEDYLRLVFCLEEGRGKIGWGGFVWKQLFHHSVLMGLRFVNRNINEDEPYVVEAATRAKNIFYTPEKLYRYRQRPGSLVKCADMDSKLLRGREICEPIVGRLSPEARRLTSIAINEAAATSIKHAVSEYLATGEMRYAKTFAPHLSRVRSLRLINGKTYRRFWLSLNAPVVAKIYYYCRRAINGLRKK